MDLTGPTLTVAVIASGAISVLTLVFGMRSLYRASQRQKEPGEKKAKLDTRASAMISWVSTFLGSIAYTGFFPIAPATFSTLVLAIVFWFWGPGPLTLLLLLIASLVLSIPIATRMEREYGQDPSECTIDELVGFLVALQGRNLADPGAWKVLLLAFFLFRFFDISKLWPGSRLEELHGGWGIVLDDFMAGLYSLNVLYVLGLLLW